MADTRERVCVFCGAEVRVDQFDHAISTVCSASGARTWQVVTAADRELHRCPHAGDLSVVEGQASR
jgi:hypothetical protein